MVRSPIARNSAGRPYHGVGACPLGQLRENGPNASPYQPPRALLHLTASAGVTDVTGYASTMHFIFWIRGSSSKRGCARSLSPQLIDLRP
jgi:hypothetical protein